MADSHSPYFGEPILAVFHAPPLSCYNCTMSRRDVAAFIVGTALFAIAPYFDSVLPDAWAASMLPVVVGMVGAALVGALVVLISGRGRMWWLGPACALVGAAVMAPFGFGGGTALGWAATTFYTFVFSGPAAAAGALLATLALTLSPAFYGRAD